MKLLLISNSTNYGEEYLGWPREYISSFMQDTGIHEILFIPYAGVALDKTGLQNSYNAYEKRVRMVFEQLGLSVSSIHHESDPVDAVNNAKAIAVGGGNTFHLVYELHRNKLIEPIRKKVIKGMPYMGWSAGSNVACPTLRTTNDMPIIEPESFNCLNLIPFQINPHYLDASPAGHGGETREQRIDEFITINHDIYVVGLREASLLEIKGKDICLKGSKPLRIFRYGESPYDLDKEADLKFLLE